MPKFTVHTGTGVPLRCSNVDTDQIIPARFCTHSSRTGHAASLFADWREDPSFVLNQPQHRGATVLIAGHDFGTGSSREYAVWALQNYGFRAVIAPRYGDIFRTNSLINGLLTVIAPADVVERLWQLVDADPTLAITVDLYRLQVRFANQIQRFTLDEQARNQLLSGVDAIAATLRHDEDISGYERRRRPALPSTC